MRRGGEGEGLVGGKVKIAQQNFTSKKKISPIFFPKLSEKRFNPFLFGWGSKFEERGPKFKEGRKGGPA